MDVTFKCKVVICTFTFLANTLVEAWHYGAEREVALDSLHTPLLGATYDSFLQREPLRNIVKRSSDWSKRQRLASPRDLSPEPQASDAVEVHKEVSTKYPRVVRKMRLQNVPLSSKHLEAGNNENVTSTFDKKGRVVRIRKFKRKTTAKPMGTTSLSPTTEKPTVNTPQVEFSHITVINKEVRDQKPNRKQKNKKQLSLWVPTQGYGDKARNTDINEMEVSSPIHQTRPTEKTHVRVPYKEQITVPKEAADQSIIKAKSALDPNHGDKSKSTADAFSSGALLAPVLVPGHAQREGSRQVNYVQPERTRPLDRHDKNLASTNASASPKSVEILSDLQPAPYDSRNHQKDPEFPDNIEQSYTTNSPLSHYTPNAGTDPGEAYRNIGFQPYPHQGGPGFRSYIPDDPFFRQPWGQTPGETQSGNGNPPLPGSFGQPFSPFYGRSNPQFRETYPSGPYHRSGNLGMPEFYHSPRLLSLRRSVMDVYSDDEPIDTTTEFSIPKFEVPSIDFNDKGCRTVYKEVNAVPAEGSNTAVENKAKSFVMTRECYFPDGVPTANPLDVKERKDVSPGAEYV